MSTPANSINETTTGVVGFTGTAFTATAVTQHDVLIGGSTSSTITNVAPSSTSGVPLISQGASSDPAFGTAVVAGGGTGATSLTAHSLLLGQGTSAITALGAATNGQIPIGSTGADPVLATITAGSNITVTNGSGSITIASTGGTSFTWNEITTTSQTMAVNNGYIANNAGLVTLTLPATAAVGDVIRVTGKGAGGWKIAQNAGQTIYFGTSTTTTGATGHLDSSQQRDGVELVCVTANNDFNVISAQGNLSVT